MSTKAILECLHTARQCRLKSCALVATRKHSIHDLRVMPIMRIRTQIPVDVCVGTG